MVPRISSSPSGSEVIAPRVVKSDTLWYLAPGVLRYVVVRSSLVNVGRSVIASTGILATVLYKLVVRYVVVRSWLVNVGRSVIASVGISDTLLYLAPGVLRYVVVRRGSTVGRLTSCQV